MAVISCDPEKTMHNTLLGCVKELEICEEYLY